MKRNLFRSGGLMLAFLLLVSGLTIMGCSDSSGPDDGTGKVRLVLTDAPFPIDMVSEANVMIDRIELRSRDTAGGESFIVLTDVDTTVNLVDLRNGLTATLAEIDVPVGDYDLVRIIVGDGEVVLTDGTEFSDLKVPSGSQTGIKVFVAPVIHVEGGLTTELLLDFDLSNSFVVQGNPNTPAGIKGFIFKPVVRAVNVSTAGRVEGTVTDSVGVGIENVYIVLRGETDEEVYVAYTDVNGYYALIGVPAGTYTLEASLEGFKTFLIPDVTIVAANKTTKNFVILIE